MQNFTRRWNSEMIERLKELHRLKTPYQEIAKVFDTSKNAIVGAVYRYIKKDNPEPLLEFKKPVIDKPLVRQNGVLSVNFKKKIKCGVIPEERTIKHKPTDWPPEWGYCQNIQGEPRNMICCGLETISGSPYCEAHYHINYQEHKPRVK